MPLNLSENQSDIHERLSAEPDRTSSIFERLRSAVAASSLVLVTQALSAIGCTKGSDQPFPDAKQIPQTASSGTAFVDDNKTAHTTACPPDKQHQLVQEFQGLATTVAQCTPCHRPGGVGWQPQNQHGWEWDASPDAANLQTSFNGFYRVSSILDANGQPYIVTHPQEKDGTKHGGGKQSLDQAQVTQLTQFSADIRKYVESLGGIKDGKLPEPPQISTDCEDPILDNKDFFADLELANSSAVYLKFLRNVTGADIPDNEPKIQTKDQLRQMLLVATNSPGFYDWLKTNLNDITLTRGLANDKKNDKKNKVSELIADTYGIDWSQFDTGDIVDSPQNLFAWMVKNDRSIKELGTAQYIVTPGIKPAQGQPDNWLARLQAQVVTEIPVSGLPTDIMWLGRHPSTKTNVHRNDSLLLLRQFYDLDVLSLGSRKLPPPPAGSLYPTLTYPPCLTCHAGSPLDLVARSMAKFDYITGKFMPKALEPPPISLINLGVYGKTIPHNDYSALRKLMGLLTWDPELSSSDPGFDANNKYRFAKAMSKMAFKFLMQHDPSIAPKDGEANYAEKNRRFKVEDKFLNEMADFLHKNGYNFRKLVVEMALSQWYAVTGEMTTNTEPTTDRKVELANFGPVPATPETLAKRLRQLLGPDADKQGLTKQINGEFAVDLGGIDSLNITTRQRDPNSAYELRLDAVALDSVGKIVVADLAKKPADRHLFPYLADWNNAKLEGPIAPGTLVPNPEIELKYKQTISNILRKAHGKYYAVNSPEVSDAYAHWLEIWQTFLAEKNSGKIADTHKAQGVDPSDLYGIIRTWEAFIASIVQSAEFNLSQLETRDHQDDYFENPGAYETLYVCTDPKTGRLQITAGVKQVQNQTHVQI